jgi:hypothetical protein
MPAWPPVDIILNFQTEDAELEGIMSKRSIVIVGLTLASVTAAAGQGGQGSLSEQHDGQQQWLY